VAPRTNVPAPIRRLFGREPAVTLLDDMFLRRERRWVALSGPPGVGKSSLAYAYAHRSLARFPGGVFGVALDGVASSQEVIGHIASRLGFAARAGARELRESLTAQGKLLLVLDGLDHVPAEEITDLVAELTVRPELFVLTTARAPLGLDAGASFTVTPLATVPRDPHSDAVELLLDRAGLTLDGSDAGVLDALVRRLDGLPLALELAAARLAIVSPEELLDRLRGDLSFLGGSLEAMMAQALDGLSDVERQLLDAWAVCPRGFDLRTAEAVAPPALKAACPDALATLRARGLLHPSMEAAGRFVVLRTIEGSSLVMGATAAREAALERFDTLLESRARSATEDVEEERVHAASGAELDALERDLALVVTRWTAGGDRLGWALAALAHHAFRHGATESRWRSLIDMWTKVEQEADAPGPAFVAAGLALSRALRGRDVSRAHEIAASATRHASSGSGRDSLVHIELAAIEGLLGNRDRAFEILDAVATRAASDRRSVARIDLHRALLNVNHGTRDSLGAMERAVALVAHEGLVVTTARAQATLGFALWQASDLRAARAAYLDGKERAGDDATLAMVGAVGAAGVAHELGEWNEAIQELEEAQRLAEERGLLAGAGFAATYRAFVHHERGDSVEARTAYEVAIRKLAAADERWVQATAHAALAALLARGGEVTLARVRLEEARARASGIAPLTSVIDVFGAVVALFEGDETSRAGAAEVARELLRERRTNVNARFGERLLRAALDAIAPPADALVLDKQRLEARPPGGAVIRLAKTPTLFRILLCLAHARREKMLEGLSTEQIFARVWPEEKFSSKSGHNRVQVALSRLRDAGFRSFIEAAGGGWRLLPSLVVIERDGPST
jgi:tetratricopeptide (TPR) repeat protein